MNCIEKSQQVYSSQILQKTLLFIIEGFYFFIKIYK